MALFLTQCLTTKKHKATEKRVTVWAVGLAWTDRHSASCSCSSSPVSSWQPPPPRQNSQSQPPWWSLPGWEVFQVRLTGCKPSTCGYFSICASAAAICFHLPDAQTFHRWCLWWWGGESGNDCRASSQRWICPPLAVRSGTFWLAIESRVRYKNNNRHNYNLNRFYCVALKTRLRIRRGESSNSELEWWVQVQHVGKWCRLQ